MRVARRADTWPEPSSLMTGHLTFVASLLLLLVSLLLVPTAAAANASDNSLVKQRVTAFLGERIRDLGRDITITVHERSARLPACENPQPFLTHPDPRLYGRVSVGLRCGEQGQQVRYLQAEVSVLVDHIVTARRIDAGAPITAADLKLEEARLEHLPRHALLNVEEAVGLTAARVLPAGTTLQEYHLKRPELVSRGDHVTVIAQGDGFTVSRDAKALDSGSLGDEVRLSTGRNHREQLRATVVGPKRLEIAF